MKRRIMAGVAVFLALAGLAGAQIQVVKTGANKAGLSLEGLKGDGSGAAQTFLRVLASDLERAGWFTLVEADRAGIVVDGRVVADARLTAEPRALVRASGRLALQRAFTGGADAAGARRLAHEVADALVEALTGQRGIAGTRLVFVGRVDGQMDLYQCDADGGNLTRLTRDGALCYAPNWFPDGRRLAYTSYRGGYPDVYRLDLDAGRWDRLVSFPGLNTGAVIAPDGGSMAIILSKDGNPELYVVNLRSRELTRLTRTRHATEASPAWSPDGREIAFVSDRAGAPNIYVIARAGGEPRRLTYQGNENVSPDWGPDGRIAHVSRRQGRYQIAVIPAAGGNPEVITADGADYEDPTWAPDGRHIAAGRTVNYVSGICVLDTLGDAPIILPLRQGHWRAPAWSPK